MKKRGLKNPAAAVAVLDNPGVQKTLEAKAEITKQAASVIPFLVKTAVVVTVAYFAFGAFSKRFKSLPYNISAADPSISEGQAQTRANALYEAMRGPGSNFNTVIQNLSGLNYNGWVRLYNAFGKRETAIPFTDPMTLEEFLLSEFSGSDLAQIRFLVPAVF